MMRVSEIKRKTMETDIELSLNIDGSGKSEIDTGCGFLNHMLVLFAKHGRFDLKVKCKGDIDVDYHHTAEDIAICMGSAFKEALADMRGIKRYGNMLLPMDEALILAAVDISGRSFLNYDVEIPCEKVGDFDCELAKEFLLGFVRKAEITLHIKKMAGENAHHIIEGIFKALARSLADACALDERYINEIPSTKGVI